MTQIKVEPVFIKTRNVRNFSVMMDGLAMSAGEGRLGLVYGRAGRGKSRTSQWYAAHNGCIYLRMATVWRTSELEFLRALCKEAGYTGTPPHRKGPAFSAVIDRLIEDPKPVFLDELEKLPRFFLDIVRDLSDLSTAPFVLIGEDELPPIMEQNRRVWSRTYRALHFEGIEIKDVIIYAREATGISLTPKVAGLFYQASGGDFRIIRRDIINLMQIVNARGTDQVDQEMAKIAIAAGLGGERKRGRHG